MKLFGLALAASMAIAGVSAHAATITSYDIENTRTSGFGGWAHSYDGSVTSTGGGLVDYAGGSGTLNDGNIGISHRNTHLFQAIDAPVITLFLDGFYTLNSLRMETFARGNAIPGTMTDVTVSFGGESHAFQPQNTANRSETVNFAGTALDGLVTDRVVLSGFAGTYSYRQYFAISEVVIDSDPATDPSLSAVPLPAGGWLLIGGMVGLAALRRKRT